MQGMNKHTGKPIAGLEHLKQSIADILTTPLGSRVMRRDYGSNLFSLVDRPYSQALVGDITMATSEALLRWEPRFELQSVSVEMIANGKLSLELKGLYLIDGNTVTLDGIVV